MCFFAVLLGAFGAHALADTLQATGRESVYELASRYQFYHGLGLLIIGMVSAQWGMHSLYSALAMLLGTVVFSGSLYLLAVTNIGIFGAITPIGGSLLLFAWARLIFDIYKTKCS